MSCKIDRDILKENVIEEVINLLSDKGYIKPSDKYTLIEEVIEEILEGG